MGLASKYFDYCNEIGILEEKYSHQHALDSLIAEVKKVTTVDPAFVEKVSNLTLNSSAVSVRSCVVYYYEADIDYVVGGNIKNTRISDFGYRHISDSIHITEFDKNAKYRVLKSSNDIPYSVYHEDCLFTLEEMKNALTNKLGDYLPKNYTSWQSKKWSVSAYIVPTLVVILNHNGSEYQLYYNLHNGYYHWEWPIDPAILNKAKKTKRLAKLTRVFGVIFGILALVFAIINKNVVAGIIGVLFGLIAFILIKKSKKNYLNIFKKNKNKSIISCMIPELIITIITFIAFIVAIL
ncbi:MAG: hypothetical protein ACI35S_01040 [Anaeroplasma sp.]